MCPWGIADNVPLRCLLTLAVLRPTHMQVEDVVLAVIACVVELERANFDVYLLQGASS